jgi:propanol-preferring alcohol dehydrogenase
MLGPAVSRLGVTWAAGSDKKPSGELDTAVLFAPGGAPHGIGSGREGRDDRMRRYWHERHTAAPLFASPGASGSCGRQISPATTAGPFLALAPDVPARTTNEVFPLESANEALHCHAKAA